LFTEDDVRVIVAEAYFIKVYINHLRDKLEVDPKKPKMIMDEPGLGYKFVSQH
jgi:two-component system KDP operon response regulator KdpE